MTAPPKVRLETSACGSRGVFVKPGQTVECGEVVAEYCGRAFWTPEGQTAELEGMGKYVFALGPVSLPVPGGQGARDSSEWLACIDAANTTARGWNVGHMLNTSHPCQVPPWNAPNCVFAVFLEDMELSHERPPRVRLFVQTTRCISRPMGRASESNEDFELRLDYHWQLASDAGFWCLDPSCEFCLDGLLDFATRMQSRRR